MSAQDTAQDKPLEASSYKLEKAKERGSVWKSADVSVLASVLCMLLLIWALGERSSQALTQMVWRGLSGVAAPWAGPDEAAGLISAQLLHATAVMGPMLLVVVLVVGLMGWLQTGGVFSTHPLKPDWTRLNPANGLKRFFNLRLVYETLKNCLKLAALVGVTYVSLKASSLEVGRLAGMGTAALLKAMLWELGGLTAKLLAVLLLFALVDMLFARWDFMRNMRMSRHEQEDEHKHREGDPRIRRRMRELRLQHLKRSQAAGRVPEADVLLTNPTHVAVALRYVHGVSLAPQVLAKGEGALAERMRDLAYRHGVPTVQNPSLARALYRSVEIDGHVPQAYYGQVAKILVWLQAQQALVRERQGMAAGEARA